MTSCLIEKQLNQEYYQNVHKSTLFEELLIATDSDLFMNNILGLRLSIYDLLTPEEVGFKILVKILSYQEEIPVQVLCHTFDYLGDYIEDVLEILKVNQESELFDLIHSTRSVLIQCNVKLSESMACFLDQIIYPIPMWVKPKDWVLGFGGGFLSCSGSVVTNKEIDYSLPCDALNKMQAIPLVLNQTVLNQKEEWVESCEDI